MSVNRKHSLCILTTVSISVKLFYEGQIEALNKAGFETTVVCADDDELPAILPAKTNFVPVGLSRVSSPIQDVKTLWKLYQLFRNKKFDIVQYSTPKASLLGSVAAFSARVPIRIYILWGLYYIGQSGLKRFIFKLFERIICLLSTNIVPIAYEMVDLVETEGLAKRSKCEVMLNGSACGVDLQKLDHQKGPNLRNQIRNKYNIPQSAVVIGVIARLTGDKGINELVSVFAEIAEEIGNVYLLIVGSQEEKDRLRSDTEDMIRTNPRILTVGWQEDPVPYYMAMDIFCLPTYREGFGKVNLEAQAMALPVVSTNVIGPRESVENTVTGFLVEPRSSEALIGPLKKLILDAELRKQMGHKARERVRQKFDSKDVIRAIVKHRLELLSRLQQRTK